MISNFTITLIVLVVLCLVAIGVLSYFVVTLGSKSSDLQSVVNTVTVTPSIPTKPSNYHNCDALRSFVSSAGHLKILAVGDAQFSGAISLNSQARVYSMPFLLNDILFNKKGWLLSTDAFFGYNSAKDDQRVILSNNTGWQPAPLPSTSFGIGGYPLQTNNNTATLIYNVTGLSNNRLQVYVMKNSGNFTVYFNGSTSPSAVTTSSLPTTGNIAIYTNTYSASITQVKIICNGAAANTCLIFGMTLDANGGDNNMMINTSVGNDCNSSSWIQTGYGTSFLGPALSAIQANLCVINIGASDITSGSSASSYTQNIVTMAQYVISQNIQPLIVIPAWTNTSGEDQYHTSLKNALDSNNIAWYDLGSDLTSYTVQAQLGLSPGTNQNLALTPTGNLRAAQGIYSAMYL